MSEEPENRAPEFLARSGLTVEEAATNLRRNLGVEPYPEVEVRGRYPFAIFPDGTISRYGTRPVPREALEALRRIHEGRIPVPRSRKDRLREWALSVAENVANGGTWKA